MATICELSAAFAEPVIELYDMFRHNAREAIRWGTQWDIIRDEMVYTADGAPARQVWGFSSAFARTDGMGGYVSFRLMFTEYADESVIDVVVSSPYESRSQQSAYYKRNHQVALRLLEFCVAPYDEIHPSVRALKRVMGGLRSDSSSAQDNAS